jgi:chromosome transmission fidelity protein 18
VLKNSILHSIESRSVFGDKKPNLIVIDEIDGAMGGQSDTSLIKFLVDLASRGAGRRAQGVNEVDDESEEEGSPQGATKVRAATGKKKKMPLQRPIICICNDAYVPALRPLRQIAQIYNLRKPEASVLAKRLKCICDLEGLKADMRALVTLCEKADCDVRTCLNTLQFLKSNSGGNRKFKISTEVIKEAPVGHKDCQKSLFSIWHDIFYVPPSKKNSGM